MVKTRIVQKIRPAKTKAASYTTELASGYIGDTEERTL